MRPSFHSRSKIVMTALAATVAVLTPALAWAAACCGGASTMPALISGDDRAQVSTSIGYTQIAVDNVDSGGVWRKWDQHQESETVRLEGAHLISDRWQAGGAVPVLQRTYLDQNYSGLGDVAGSVGYEYLPDWDYSVWRPKGLGYLQLNLPTGKSKAESDIGGLDSRGNGFWSVGAGTLLTKIIHHWDVFTTLEIHRSFAKEFSNSQMQGELQPGFGESLGFGCGYNLRSWRLGSSLTWTYEDPVAISTSSGTIPGSLERYATAVASASYLVDDEWSGTLSYSDQTLFGSPVNTSLGRSIMLQMQRRWAR